MSELALKWLAKKTFLKTIPFLILIFCCGLFPDSALSEIQVKITASPISGSLSYEQSMAADILDARQPIHYVWDFGDASVSFDVNPTHAYGSPGEYRVWLNIMDADGQTGNAVYWVQVRHDVFQKDQQLTKQYLNASRANCLYQDHYHSNLVWVGTNGGLICADLKNNVQKYYRSQLPAGMVQDICQLFDNSLWFATTNGLVRFEPDSRQWTTFNTQNTVMTENHVHALARSMNQKKLWIGTLGGGIFCWDALQKKWFEYSAKNTDLPSNHVQDLTVDHDDNLWIATHRGLAVLNPSTEQWQIFKKDSSGLPDDVINVVEHSENGKIWIGTWNQGIACFDPASNVWQPYNSGNSPLKMNYVDHLLSTPDGNIWIAAEEKGLFLFNPETDSWHIYTHENSPLPDPHVNALTTSDDNTVIINVNDYLIQMDIHANKQHCMILNQRYLPDNSLACVSQAENETLWLGFRNHGLSRFNPKNHEWSGWDPMNSPLPAYDVRCIVEISDGQMAVGTSNGLAVFNDTHRQWSIYQTQNSAIPDNNVTALLYDKNAYLWMGTTQGVARFHPTTLQWKNFQTDTNDLKDHITCLAQSSDGRIWAGTAQNGLLGFQYIDETWERFNQGTSDLSDNHIQTIIGTQSRHLWIGTLYSGLSYFDLDTETWKSYDTTNSALLHNTITALSDAQDGVLWLGDNYGHIYRFHSLTKEWHTLSLNENISDMTTLSAIVASDKDKLWVGTQGSGLFQVSWPRSLESQGSLLIIQAEDDVLSEKDQHLSLENIYRTFSNHDFQHRDIFMAALGETLDINGDGIPDPIIDSSPDRITIQKAIAQWAVDAYSSNKPFFVFIQGQWSINTDTQTPELHLADNQRLSALELHNAFALYEQETGGQIVVVISGENANQSLPFMTSKSRTLITSGHLSAYGSFLYYFLNGLDSQLSVYDAFKEARKQESLWIHKTAAIPRLDDNGDGVPDILDGVFANQIQLNPSGQNSESPFVQDIRTSPVTSDSLALTVLFNVTMVQASARMVHTTSDIQQGNFFTINMTACRPMTFCGEIQGVTPTGNYELAIMAQDYYGRMLTSEPLSIIIGDPKYGSLKGQVELLIAQHAFTYNDAHLVVQLLDSNVKAAIQPDASFRFDNIPEGIYPLEISGPGFQFTGHDAVHIIAGETQFLPPITIDIESLWCSSDTDCNGVTDLKDVIYLLQQLIMR
ncbi:MAG: PKD domain-containing protein [Candidatus Magnetomorum sp.]|nr:PKD domain-containing protein [Candidatus Magnetomorum sp.]